MSGPSALSPKGTRSGMSAAIASVSHRTWITLGLIFAGLVFLIVYGVIQAGAEAQRSAREEKLQPSNLSGTVLEMIDQDEPEEGPFQIPELEPLGVSETPPPEAPAGPTYRQIQMARMFAMEQSASESALTRSAGGGAAVLGSGAVTDPFEQQLNSQLELLQGRLSVLGGPDAGTDRPGQAEQGVQTVTTAATGVSFTPAPSGPSRLVIHEGWDIPCRLDQWVTSDIGGDVRGLVSRDVYDSITGRYLLIPAGSRVIGRYESGVVFGANRLAVVWERLIFPNGASMRFRSAGTDGRGSAGFRDRVNNHWSQVVGAALLTSMFSTTLALSNDRSGSVLDEQSSADIARANAAREVAGVGAATTRRALTIPPTIEIRPGYAFNIRVNRDWTLPAWHGKTNHLAATATRADGRHSPFSR